MLSNRRSDPAAVNVTISLRSTFGSLFLNASAGLRASSCCSTARVNADLSMTWM